MPPRPRLGSSEPGRSWLFWGCALVPGGTNFVQPQVPEGGTRGALGPAGWTARDGAREAKATPHPNVLGLRLLAVAHVYLIVCLLRKKKCRNMARPGEYGLVGQADGPSGEAFP